MVVRGDDVSRRAGAAISVLPRHAARTRHPPCASALPRRAAGRLASPCAAPVWRRCHVSGAGDDRPWAAFAAPGRGTGRVAAMAPSRRCCGRDLLPPPAGLATDRAAAGGAPVAGRGGWPLAPPGVVLVSRVPFGATVGILWPGFGCPGPSSHRSVGRFGCVGSPLGAVLGMLCAVVEGAVCRSVFSRGTGSVCVCAVPRRFGFAGLPGAAVAQML